MVDLPVIVLAFANEYGAERYLTRLAQEQKQLWGSVKGAETLCEPELVINATLDNINRVFEKYKQRVAIFHYDGHAHGNCLLLASLSKARETDLRGLLGFWGRKGGLRLVFLSGCSIQLQIDDLLRAGVSAVVATARPINDDAACRFTDATNAALAVNSAGTGGLPCQELTGSGSARRWKTQFSWSTDGGTAWNALPLADTPADTPVKTFDTYLGDYDHLVVVGAVFYGIFSANNTPDPANFPSGVKYQRNADFNKRRLLALNNTSAVAASIDPFFFKVTGV
jgi:hypothetical protein